MRAARRFRLIGAAVAAVELLLGVLLLGTILDRYFWCCAAATLAVALIAGRFLEAPPAEPGDDPRGGRRDPRPPGPPEPAWWPEFERELAEHADRWREAAPTS